MTALTATPDEPSSAITKAEAGELWIKLRDSWATTSKTIKEIINTRAWEPLGYVSFFEAWREEVGLDAELDRSVAMVIAVQFAVEGVGDAQILALPGVGPRTLPAVRTAAKVGLDKPVIRRASTAELPSVARRITVDFEPEERARFAHLAERNGTSLVQESEKAIRAWFDRMEKRLERK